MKFIGHLDIMRYFQKAMRRADIDICYSEGFSPHQIMSFAAPLGVGITSDGEYLDIEVHESKSTKEAMADLNAMMVEGVEITGYVKLPDNVTWTMQASVSSLRREVAAVKGMREDEVSGEMIYEWETAGDKAVIDVLEDWYLNIAKHCMNIHVILAPDIILLGGGISAEPRFIQGVKKYVDKLAKFSVIYNEMQVGLCKFGNDSNLIGALFNYLQKYEGAH